MDTVSELEKNQRISFQEILSKAQLEREIDPSIVATAKFLFNASYFDQNKDVIKEAKERLVKEDPRKLFLDCLKFLVKKIQTVENKKRHLWVDRFFKLAVNGLGLKVDDLEFIGKDSKNIFRSEPKWDKIKEHIDKVVLGDSFLIQLSVPEDNKIWRGDIPFRISACDASQHKFKLKLPYFNKTLSTPIVINNAAGIIKERNGKHPNLEQIVVPKSTQDFENWVIVGIDEYTNLEENDYRWATQCAMDVGQYYVEESFIFTHGGSQKRPDVHLRDGTIFPSDRAMNCKLDNRHGELTRESILRMTTTLQRAKELDIMFCGVTKVVQLKIFSIAIDYYIKEVMGEKKWNATDSLLPDSEIMRFMLFEEEFNGTTFEKIFVTCAVLRSYFVKSNLNAHSATQLINDLKSLEGIYHGRTKTARQIVEAALGTQVAMFFVGHFNSDNYYVPRYEFVFYEEERNQIKDKMLQLISAIRLSTIELDQDHMRDLEQPILVPLPIMHAHELSKAWGKDLVENWEARTWKEYMKLKNNLITSQV